MHTHRHKPLPPRSVFVRHMSLNALWATGVVVAALGAGMAGYHYLESMPWMDAFLNAAMILSGMGPADAMHTDAGKLFAGCYAIFSGIVFIGFAALILAPLLHRFLHRFHLSIEPTEEGESKKPEGSDSLQ
jgi:NhaP-type Na+/H+ or K+/H+ antiporter